jgi:SAM-dependent methyltransferase
MISMRTHFAKARNALAHLWGRVSGKYYVEDFVRVYPDGLCFTHRGPLPVPASREQINNFLNHRKFYAFAAQFARDVPVADIGCGSGYGSALLKDTGGAARVCGADVSRHAVRFAREHYGTLAEFSVQGITRLARYADGQFGLVVSSEVLEHIKEYHKEAEALEEIKRIARPGGVIVIGTPNCELLGDHGFSFDEIDGLLRRHFTHYRIFENALVPPGASRQLWQRRLAEGRTGVIVTQEINLEETVLAEGVTPELKKGIPAGFYSVGPVKVDTRRLHNTHSWAIVAIKDGG